MIVADTGAMLALTDADDHHHPAIRAPYESDPESRILPWAILPEVDYLLMARVGARAVEAFPADLASRLDGVERGGEGDLSRARDIGTKSHRHNAGFRTSHDKIPVLC